MTLTILYRHRDRPDEAGMTMILGQQEVAARVDQLERRGFIVDKITARSLPPPSLGPQAPASAGPDPARLGNRSAF
jgi:hypothetical protein